VFLGGQTPDTHLGRIRSLIRMLQRSRSGLCPDSMLRQFVFGGRNRAAAEGSDDGPGGCRPTPPRSQSPSKVTAGPVTGWRVIEQLAGRVLLQPGALRPDDSHGDRPLLRLRWRWRTHCHKRLAGCVSRGASRSATGQTQRDLLVANSGCFRSGPTGPAFGSGLVCVVATALARWRRFWRASGAAGRRIQPVAPAPCASPRRRALGATGRGPRRSSRRLSHRS
jgi:hypothetical protein